MKTKGIWGLALVVLLSFTSVFAQPFDVVRDDFQVNQTTEGSMTSPRMARSGNGSFVIVWVQEIDTTLSHIRGRLYDDNGQEIGDEFRVNSGGESSYKSRPRVDMNIHGEFAVVWKDNRDDWRKAVYGRAYDGNGNPLSEDFRVSPADSQFIKGEIAIDGEGYLRIAYVKQSPNEVSVMLFDYDGSPVEQLTHYPGNLGTYKFAMMGNDYGFFTLLGIPGYYNAKCEIFDGLGESISGLFQIGPEDGCAWVERYQVTDIEIRNDNYIYATCAAIFGGAYSCDPHPERHYNLFNPDGERVNGFYQSHTTYDPLMGMSISGSVSFGWSDGGAKGAWADNSFSGFRDIWDVSNEGAGQVRDVATECDDTRIFYTWSDDRNDSWDIYAKVYAWNVTSVQEDSPQIPFSEGLLVNYPNPFNAHTTIIFGLSMPGAVTLDIFDLLGRKVETLVDNHLEPGQHSVTWDASQYSSGVYFYKLTTNEKSFTKRMVLLK